MPSALLNCSVLGHYNGRSSTPNHYPDCYLHLTIKDKGVMGNGIFLGEALLPLTDIGSSDVNKCLRDFPQLQLPLTKPTDHGETLEQTQHDLIRSTFTFLIQFV